MEIFSRLLLPNTSSVRVQRLVANFTAVRRAISYDATTWNESRPRYSNESRRPHYFDDTRNTNSQGSRDSRPQRRDNGRRGRQSGPLMARLIRETSGRVGSTLSYAEKQARWNELHPATGKPTRDVKIRHVLPFVTIDSIQSTFPAVETAHYRNYEDETIDVRFSSVEEAEKAVNAINNAVEFPFAISQGPKLGAGIKTQPPIRAKYIATHVTDPQTTSIYIAYYQGTENALREKLEPYVPAGHTLQFRYGQKGQVWADMGSIEAVKEACEALQGVTHICEIPLLALPAAVPKPWRSSTPEEE